MPHETLPELIWRHVDAFVTRGHGGGEAMNMITFASAVREHYENAVPHHKRRVHFSDNPDAGKRMENDAQIIRRFKQEPTGTNNPNKFGLPAELVDSVIDALTVLGYIHMDTLNTELAARRNMLPVPIPPVGNNNAIVHASRITKEAGDVLVELSAMGESIGPEDAHRAKGLLQQLHELKGVLHSLEAQVIEIIPERDKASVTRIA